MRGERDPPVDRRRGEYLCDPGEGCELSAGGKNHRSVGSGSTQKKLELKGKG